MNGAVVAVDMGGTRIKAARVEPDAAGTPRVVSSTAVDAPGDVTGALDVLTRLLAELGDRCAGVGLAVPGLVRSDGIIQALPGKYDGIVGFDLPSWLRRRLDVPAVVVNDAIAYGVGEATHGAGRQATRVLVLTIGTGVGVSVIEGGRPISTGPLGGGISGGNVLISEEGGDLVDTAGRTGTVEARCRADRIVDYARMQGADADDVRAVYALARDGHAGALRAVEVYRSWLAKAIAALAVAHGVDGVVVGGGPATPDAPWLPGLEELVLPRLWPSHHLSLAVSALGDAAAPVGLTHLVWSS
ncbi:MAG: ROK family protein [Frankiaceae bacterium]|nr:ROK family protein [Frankiaceae bacterium]